MSDRQTELLELLDRSGAGLYALLTRLTLREDVAEELMQDLFLKLNGAENQGGIDCWCAYARRTAINLAFDWRRRQATRRACSLDGLPERASDADALDASARTQGSINVNTFPSTSAGTPRSRAATGTASSTTSASTTTPSRRPKSRPSWRNGNDPDEERKISVALGDGCCHFRGRRRGRHDNPPDPRHHHH